MNARTVLATIACLALLPLLAACGASLTEASLDESVSGDLAALALEGNAFVAGVLANPTSIGSVASAQSGLRAQEIVGACDVSASGDETDFDGDTVPVSASFSIDCSFEETESGAGFSIVGATRAQDADDADALSGYRVETDRYTLTITDADANVYELGLDLDAELARSTGFAYDYDLVFELAGSSPEGSGRIEYETSASYLPDSAGDPFAAGEITYDGGLRFEHDGRFYQLTATTVEALHYRETCSSGFDDGSVRYSDTEGSSLTITYNGCDDVTVNFVANGG